LTFTASGALFQQTAEQLQQRLGDRYDASKNYPQYDGIMNIPADQAYALAQYLMNLRLQLRLTAWSQPSKTNCPSDQPGAASVAPYFAKLWNLPSTANL
jgi:hypothetical protein